MDLAYKDEETGREIPMIQYVDSFSFKSKREITKDEPKITFKDLIGK